jgi:NADPH:quinone reductase
MMAGRYQTKPSLLFSPGLETAGVIAVCGREASGFKPGDRVMAILQYGGLAEFAATPAKAFFLPAMLQPAAPDLFRRRFVTGEVS